MQDKNCIELADSKTEYVKQACVVKTSKMTVRSALVRKKNDQTKS